MPAETRLQSLEFRLMTVNLLRTAKEKYTYNELSKYTGLKITELSRYVRGHVLPTLKRSKEIWSTLSRLITLESEISNRIKFDELGYFDNTSIIFNIPILRQAAQHALHKFAGRRVTKVLTAAVDGIPLATVVANALGVNIVVAKKEKEVGVSDFVEEAYIPSNSAVMVTLFIPKGAIKKGDSVLIIDDIIRSGETQRALINLIEKSKGEVAGIFTLITLGDEWRSKIPTKYPLEAVLRAKLPILPRS